MLKKLSFSLFFFLLVSPVFAQESDVISLTKSQIHLFSYAQNSAFEKALSDGSIHISFEWTGMILSQNLEKRFFNLRVYNADTATGKIILSSSQGIKELRINLSENLKRKDFSLFPKLVYTRLQSKPLSCESSATADILSYLLGKDITESEILKNIPKSSYYNKLPLLVDGKRIWWNPNEWFVWYDSFFRFKWFPRLPKQSEFTGYGVYEKPISKLVENTYGLNTKIMNTTLYSQQYTQKEHIFEILSAIEQGNMVLLWWDRCTREDYDDGVKKSTWAIWQNSKWKTENAQNYCENTNENRNIHWYVQSENGLSEMTGLAWEHAFYLLWYKGTKENPEKIYVWDTETWYHKYDTIEWLRKWNLMDNRSLIIYKK